jgi:prevent-host-death family protein
VQTVNIHEAKTHLSRLLGRLAQGESFIIAKAGKPVAKLVPFSTESEAEPKPIPRIGFLKDSGFKVPDDFDTMFADEIREMFEGKE